MRIITITAAYLAEKKALAERKNSK